MDETALQELADSIREHGLLQPIVVRGIEGDRYEIIAGERRFRAAALAQLQQVPVIVKEVSDENALAISALIENIQREDLNPLEEATAIRRLLDEFSYTHEQAAQAIGRSRSATSNLLRLLNLADPVQTMLLAGDIEMGHARCLLSLDRAQQILIAHQIVQRRLSVREAEKLVNQTIVAAERSSSFGQGANFRLLPAAASMALRIATSHGCASASPTSSAPRWRSSASPAARASWSSTFQQRLLQSPARAPAADDRPRRRVGVGEGERSPVRRSAPAGQLLRPIPGAVRSDRGRTSSRRDAQRSAIGSTCNHGSVGGATHLARPISRSPGPQFRRGPLVDRRTSFDPLGSSPYTP